VQRMSSCLRHLRWQDETHAASAQQLVEGRLTVQTGNNGLSMNCPGVCLAPSQVTVLVMG